MPSNVLQVKVKVSMDNSTVRVSTSFRLQEGLLQELKECAKAANRSLNNYVECILLDVMKNAKAKDESVITPELKAKIDKARDEHERGETLRFETAQDAINWMEAL